MRAVSSTLSDLISDLPRERSSLLPALQRIQRAMGHCSADAVEVVAAHCRITPSDADGIASGYPDLRRTPAAGVTVRVCVGLSCVLERAEELRVMLERNNEGQDAEIGTAPCLFACAMAPVVEIDGECFGRATQESAMAVLRARRGDSE